MKKIILFISFFILFAGLNQLSAVHWSKAKHLSDSYFDKFYFVNDSIVAYNYGNYSSSKLEFYNLRNGLLIGKINTSSNRAKDVKFLTKKNKIAVIFESKAMNLYSPFDLSKSSETYSDVYYTEQIQYEFNDDVSVRYIYDPNFVSVRTIDMSNGEEIFSGYINTNPGLIRYSYLSESNDEFKIYTVLDNKIIIYSAEDASLIDSYDYTVSTDLEPKFCKKENRLVYIDGNKSLTGLNLESGNQSYDISIDEKEIDTFGETEDGKYVWVVYYENYTLNYEIYDTKTQELHKKGILSNINYYGSDESDFVKITNDLMSFTYIGAVSTGYGGMPTIKNIFYIIDFEDGGLKGAIPEGATGSSTEFIFNNDGSKMIAYGHPFNYNEENTIYTNVVWDVKNEKLLHRFSSDYSPDYFSANDEQVYFFKNKFIYIYNFDESSFVDTIETSFKTEGLHPLKYDERLIQIDGKYIKWYDIEANIFTDSLQLISDNDVSVTDFHFNEESSEILVLTSNYNFYRFNYVTKQLIDTVYLNEAETLEHQMIEISPEGTHLLAYTLEDDDPEYHYTFYSWNVKNNSIEYHNSIERTYFKNYGNPGWYLNSAKTIYYYIYSDPVNDSRFYKGMNLSTGETCNLHNTNKEMAERADISPDKKHYAYNDWHSYYVTMLCDPLYLSVENELILKNNGILISPNPASDYIEISFPENHGVNPLVVSDEIAIYDVLGERVAHSSTQSLRILSGAEVRNEGHFDYAQCPVKIDISHLPKGVYFVRFGERVEKFVKK